MATIDERLEALTHNLELLDERMEDVERIFRENILPGFHALLQAVSHLLRTAQLHEDRLERREKDS